jgi:cellulase/cellobiase CelA1
VKYAVTGSWPGGYQAAVTLTNTGSAAISGWTLRWTMPSGHTVASLWGGTVSSSGANVTVANPDWNRTIAAGANVQIGFIGSGDGATSTPSSFTVNGSSCTTS